MNESKVIARWRAEGRAEGRLETLRADLLQVLHARFGTSIPSDLEAFVRTLTDDVELSRLLVAAATSNSVEAFREALQTANSNH